MRNKKQAGYYNTCRRQQNKMERPHLHLPCRTQKQRNKMERSIYTCHAGRKTAEQNGAANLCLPCRTQRQQNKMERRICACHAERKKQAGYYMTARAIYEGFCAGTRRDPAEILGGFQGGATQYRCKRTVKCRRWNIISCRNKKSFGMEQDRTPAFEVHGIPVTQTVGSRAVTPRHTRRAA